MGAAGRDEEQSRDKCNEGHELFFHSFLSFSLFMKFFLSPVNALVRHSSEENNR
ncbi:hypothetical protein MUS_0255 [Bacillus velezensis YAU B9601-Y2]|uniref:Uncharacterized protein n=1 Tax=Bacillus amyloliquefaciens (strain Y2) TaxID=1155777 RepID=I2C113_BACAY|nr:hypothetical protein MUS_0255 [Bacillus velezensis YAU B9601-Y2]